MEIQFDQFVIRSWRSGDALSLQKHADNRKIWLNLRNIFPSPYSEEHARCWISLAQDQVPERNYAIAIGKETVGGIGFVFQEDVHQYSAELGYWLAEPYWGRGIMPRAVKKMTEYAFSHYPVIRLFAAPFSRNKASHRVLEKAGYQQEGILKNHVVKDGKVLDQVVYGITSLRSHAVIELPL